MSLYESFVKVFHNIVEDKFSTDFELSSKKEVDSFDMSTKDITFEFDFINHDFNQKIYYFIDKKFARNLFSAVIEEVNATELDNDLTTKIINLLNNKISDKINNDLKINCFIKNGELLTDIKNHISLSVYYLSSLKGSIFIGFVNKTKPAIDNNNLHFSKKTSGSIFQNQIIQIKEKKDESSLISAVQLLEIKKQVLMSLSEIKDLKGDPDFLLRKAKTVSELSRLWFDISKEEH
jgi:hypothetical protein